MMAMPSTPVGNVRLERRKMSVKYVKRIGNACVVRAENEKKKNNKKE